jgi:hypothetical protein
LLAQGGLYRRLYDLQYQFRDGESRDDGHPLPGQALRSG